MAPPPASDTSLQRLIDRLASNDPAAADTLISHSMERLRRLTHRRLQDRPDVRRYDQTDDVLQEVMMRLRAALTETRPTSVAGYFGLAAQHIRWELLDRARHYYGPQGEGANHATDPKVVDRGGKVMPRIEAEADPATGPVGLLEWSEFHEYVEKLPADDRQLFDLIVYNGMSQRDAACVLGISERMVQRRWTKLKLRIYDWAETNAPSRSRSV